MPAQNPYQPLDDAYRGLVHALVREATHAALAFQRPGTTLPSVSRIALATDHQGQPISLLSSLSDHSRALQNNPACALLIGDPGPKGDPLTHPRLTLHVTAHTIPRASEKHEALRDRYLSLRPKAKLYIDFADFSFVRFDIQDGLLNGGFGKAHRVAAADFRSSS